MATILVVEKDPVFGAVLEDRLQVAGHRVELVLDPERALAAATADATDLMIYELTDGGDGLEVVRQLRQGAETRSLPILALSAGSESSDRIAALRAGVDDYLSKPCDLEELLLRADRLIASRSAQAPALHGDLASHPLWELMQYLQQTTKSGVLVLRGKTSGGGRITVRDGKITAAQWAELPVGEALLAVFGLKEGRFRFVSAADEAAAEPAEPVSSIHEVLLEAAWLEDELAKRRESLPATGVPLAVTGKALSPLDDELESVALPAAEIQRLVSAEPGLRIFDLIGRVPLAPQKIRLAVAWLAEKGIVGPGVDNLEESFPSTTEITSSLLLDVAVDEFLKAARQAGFDAPVLPFLILTEPDVWSALLSLIENVPGYQGNQDLRAFAASLKRRQGGSVTFAGELGRLSLHAQVLKSGSRAQIEAVVAACAGVLIWLDEGGEAETARGVIERLERAKGRASGLLVATKPLAREIAPGLLTGMGSWRVSPHEPLSLLGVLRLLQPTGEG